MGSQEKIQAARLPIEMMGSDAFKLSTNEDLEELEEGEIRSGGLRNPPVVSAKNHSTISSLDLSSGGVGKDDEDEAQECTQGRVHTHDTPSRVKPEEEEQPTIVLTNRLAEGSHGEKAQIFTACSHGTEMSLDSQSTTPLAGMYNDNRSASNTPVQANSSTLGGSADPPGSSSATSSPTKNHRAEWIKQDPDESLWATFTSSRHPHLLPISAPSSARPFLPLKRKASEEDDTPRPSKIMQSRLAFGVRTQIDSLKHLRTLVRQHDERYYWDTTYEDWMPLMANIRNKLHEMMFCTFINDHTIEQSKVLCSQDGLQRLYNCGRGPGAFGDYAWDVQDFAYGLALRWKNGDYDSDLLRGIRVRRGKRANRSHTTRTVDPDYAFKVNPKYSGGGDLLVGDWWPYQVCCVRDGAHGELEAGISGSLEHGAYSIVLSGSKYEDLDNGDSLEYCGTKGKAKEASLGTSKLLKSYELNLPVRVLRFHKLPKENPYRPLKGIRYDGLYKIVSHELWDAETSMFRFTLHREPSQRPIPYEGVAQRPTRQELQQYDQLRFHVNQTNKPLIE